MKLSMIIAVSNNGVIGCDNKLPWHIPEDLRRFKALTMGHHLIMGRRTFESLGRLLPGRTSIVLTHKPDMRIPGGLVAQSLDEAITLVGNDDQPFIIGGAAVFEAAVPLVQRIYVTRVLVDCQGDTRFELPALEKSWQMIEQSAIAQSQTTATPYRFEVWQRMGPG